MGHPLDWILAICLLARCTANCAPGQCVEYNGYVYRTLDGTHPDVTSVSCQDVYLLMLDGWALSGYSADSRHVGSSHPWGTNRVLHSTTSGHCSATTACPSCSCSDKRVLVSGATYKPSSCNMRILIAQPTTTTTTTTTFTTTTVTATTTTTTTTTTVTCIEGSGRNAEGGCSPCPAGRMADAGAFSCLPTLAYAVSSLDTPNLSLDADHGFVRGLVDVTPLPSPLYEAVALQYSIDAGTNASNFSMQSSCSQRWTAVNSSHIVAALPYSSLDEDCPLNTSVEGGEVHRRGTFGVLLGYRLAGGGPITPVMQWLFPQRLRFPGLVQAVHSHLLVTEHSGHAETDVHGPTFEASLALFESDAFTTLKRIPAYHKHDVVHAAISLVQKLNFDLRVTSAWLSKSADPSAPAEHNISASVQAIGAMGPKGQGFSAVLETCVGCYIHAEAELALPSGDTRRLHIVPSASAFTEISVREAPVDTDPMDRSPSGPSNPDLPLAPPTCLLVAAATAFFFSMLTRLAISVSGQRQRFAGFACVEFVDVITDIVVYIACRGEGDFRFDNDENGLLATALLTSTSLNMGLLTLELALFFFGPKCLGYGLPAIAVPWLACIHLMLEDCFQLVLYALVSGAQATEGLGQRPAVVLAVVQSGLFILWKVKDAVDWEEIVNKSAYRTRVAADDWES